jgi:hypothetical protein
MVLFVCPCSIGIDACLSCGYCIGFMLMIKGMQQQFFLKSVLEVVILIGAGTMLKLVLGAVPPSLSFKDGIQVC